MKVWDSKNKKTVEKPYPNVVDESELVSLQIIDGMGKEKAEKKDKKFNFKNLIDLKKFFYLIPRKLHSRLLQLFQNYLANILF